MVFLIRDYAATSAVLCKYFIANWDSQCFLSTLKSYRFLHFAQLRLIVLNGLVTRSFQKEKTLDTLLYESG